MSKIILLLFLFSCGSVTRRDSVGGPIAKSPKKEIIMQSLDAELIRKIIVDNLPKIKNCYDRQIDQGGKTFTGMVTMKFTIKESGLVNQTSIIPVDPSFPRSVSECVSSALKSIIFPKSKSGSVEVSQPFNFGPKKS